MKPELRKVWDSYVIFMELKNKFSVVRQLMLDIRYLVQCMIVSISENVHCALNKTDKCGIQKNTDHMMMRIKGKEVPKGVSKTYTPESPWHAPPLIMCDLL